jgi:hypothetical protein
MNRRVQGRVKQARKRAQKRLDIRMGRRQSMQQMLYNTHSHAEPETVVETPVTVENNLFQLVNKETGQVLQVGSQTQMRKQRAISLEANPEGAFSVRKVK